MRANADLPVDTSWLRAGGGWCPICNRDVLMLLHHMALSHGITFDCSSFRHQTTLRCPCGYETTSYGDFVWHITVAGAEHWAEIAMRRL